LFGNYKNLINQFDEISLG